ncbi:MAG: glycosyltransferase family 4 protein [Acidobacteriota bacterium]
MIAPDTIPVFDQQHRSVTVCQIGAFHAKTSRTPTNADTLKGTLATLGIESVCASHHTSRILRPLDMIWTLCRQRRRFRVVIIHVYSGNAFLWALSSAFVARVLGKPLILWLHGGDLPAYSRRHPRLLEFTFRRAIRILAPSNYLKGRLAGRFAIGLMPYELPISSYPYRLREQARESLLWVRAFDVCYNPQLAVRVIHILRTEFPAVRLVMCGPDNGDGSLQATQSLARSLGVAEAIEIPGKVTKERIKELGLAYDIFLNTTDCDNTPVSVIEALAMGMCVVSTDVGGVPALVEHRVHGLLVPPGNPEAMANACREILRQPEAARRLSTNARLKADSFDIGVLADAWKRLIEEIDSGSGCQHLQS